MEFSSLLLSSFKYYFPALSLFCSWFMRESMALHETRDQETWQLSGRTELSRAPVSHGCAAQPLLAASHEEALRNVRKLLRAGLWAPGSGAAERSLNWDWHWDMSHWDTGINPVGRRNKQYTFIIRNKIFQKVSIIKCPDSMSTSVGGDIYERESESRGKLWGG